LQNFDSFTPPKAEGECNIGFLNKRFASPQSQSRMGFKISARVGERFFKHFVFQIHFSKTKPVQAKFESQKWRQEENVS
jgi:hypothetical protein